MPTKEENDLAKREAEALVKRLAEPLLSKMAEIEAILKNIQDQPVPLNLVGRVVPKHDAH